MFILILLLPFLQKDILFEKRIRKRGLVVKKMSEDGACLFRAVADQVYGDQDMHGLVRKSCMDYMVFYIITLLICI